MTYREKQGINTDAVADEVRRVFRDDDALAEMHTPEMDHTSHEFGVGVRRGDHLEQLEIAGRIEEVRPHEATAERFRASLGDLVDGQPARVRRDDGVLAGGLLDAGHHLPLDVHSLEDGLDNPIGLSDPVEVVLEVAELDAFVGVIRKERIGFELHRPFEGGFHDRVLVASLRRRNVEQTDLQPGVGAVGGDLCTHRARAEHGDGAERPKRPSGGALPGLGIKCLCFHDSGSISPFEK